MAGDDPAGEVRRKLKPNQRLLLIDDPCQLSLARDKPHGRECPRRSKPLNELVGNRTAIEVEYRQGRIFHFERGCKRKEQQLQDDRQEKERTALRVAQ